MGARIHFFVLVAALVLLTACTRSDQPSMIDLAQQRAEDISTRQDSRTMNNSNESNETVSQPTVLQPSVELNESNSTVLIPATTVLTQPSVAPARVIRSGGGSSRSSSRSSSSTAVAAVEQSNVTNSILSNATVNSTTTTANVTAPNTSSNLTPPQNTTNSSGQGSKSYLSVLSGWPQDHNVVFECTPPFAATQYTWDFGDGITESSSTSQRFHKYDANATYNVSCTATSATESVTSTLSLTISTPTEQLTRSYPYLSAVQLDSINGAEYTFSCPSHGYTANTTWWVTGQGYYTTYYPQTTEETLTLIVPTNGNYTVHCTSALADATQHIEYYNSATQFHTFACASFWHCFVDTTAITVSVTEAADTEHDVIFDGSSFSARANGDVYMRGTHAEVTLQPRALSLTAFRFRESVPREIAFKGGTQEVWRESGVGGIFACNAFCDGTSGEYGIILTPDQVPVDIYLVTSLPTGESESVLIHVLPPNSSSVTVDISSVDQQASLARAFEEVTFASRDTRELQHYLGDSAYERETFEQQVNHLRDVENKTNVTLTSTRVAVSDTAAKTVYTIRFVHPVTAAASVLTVESADADVYFGSRYDLNLLRAVGYWEPSYNNADDYWRSYTFGTLNERSASTFLQGLSYASG